VHVYALPPTRLTVCDVETGGTRDLPLRYTVADGLAGSSPFAGDDLGSLGPVPGASKDRPHVSSAR
jgi:hypothetical protein